MRILLDQGTPAPLRRHLQRHAVDTAFERGLSSLRNGELLDRAEADGYELLITTNQNLRHQQNLAGRQLAIVVLLAAWWPRIQGRVDDIQVAADRAEPGMYIEIPIRSPVNVDHGHHRKRLGPTDLHSTGKDVDSSFQRSGRDGGRWACAALRARGRGPSLAASVPSCRGRLGRVTHLCALTRY